MPQNKKLKLQVSHAFQCLMTDVGSLPVRQCIFLPFRFSWEKSIVCNVRNSAPRLLDDIQGAVVQLPSYLQAKERLHLPNLPHHGAATADHFFHLGSTFWRVILVKIFLKYRGGGKLFYPKVFFMDVLNTQMALLFLTPICNFTYRLIAPHPILKPKTTLWLHCYVLQKSVLPVPLPCKRLSSTFQNIRAVILVVGERLSLPYRSHAINRSKYTSATVAVRNGRVLSA